jgi:proliferating cell nuclear antigen PCNA
MSSTIVRAKTEHTHELTKFFDVLKEVLNDIKIDFIRDENQKVRKSDEEGNDDSSDYSSNSDDSDSDEKEKTKKKPVKKTVTKKGKNDHSESDSEDDPKKKPKKKPTNKKDESDSDSDDAPKKGKKKAAVKKGKKHESDNSDDDSDDAPKKGKKKAAVKKGKSDETSESESEDDSSKKDTKNKKKSTGGIRILAVDDHQTLLIYAKLHANQFVDFYVKPPCHSIGLDLLVLHKFMKTVDRESIMTMEIDKDDEQYITFSLENNVKKNTAFYKQKLLDVDDDPKKLPQDANFEMSVRMDTSEFRKICQEMSYFSDFVEITCTNKELTFKCQGDSTAYVKTFKNCDTGVTITLQGKSKGLNMVQAIYHLKHLVTFGKCVSLCSEMQLLLRNDFPLFIHYTIGNLGKMIVGLSPVDEKTIKRDNDYDETNDKYYNTKNIKMKEEA